MMGNAVFKNLLEIESEPVRWLWEGRIPSGKVTLLQGEPGIGKTMLALELAARVSRGASMPPTKGHEIDPGNVVVFTGDDGLADTIRPRLEAAGADLSRIWAVDREIDKDDLAQLHPSLIILDPLAAYICMSCERDPIQVMRNLGRLARETGAAVLAVLSSDEKDHVLRPEFYSTPRSILSLTAVGHGGRRLAITKSNLRNIPDVHPMVYYLNNEGGVVRIVNWSDGR